MHKGAIVSIKLPVPDFDRVIGIGASAHHLRWKLWVIVHASDLALVPLDVIDFFVVADVPYLDHACLISRCLYQKNKLSISFTCVTSDSREIGNLSLE